MADAFFSVICWASMLLLAISVSTWGKIALKVSSGVASTVDSSLFSGAINSSLETKGRPGWHFLTFAGLDLVAVGALLSIYFLISATGFIKWLVLLAIVVYFSIKATYFIRVFRQIGLLDENEPFG